GWTRGATGAAAPSAGPGPALLGKTASAGLLLAVASKCGALGDIRSSLADLVFCCAFGAAYAILARPHWRSLPPLAKGLAVLAPVGLLPLGLASLYGGLAYLAVCLYVLGVLLARTNPAEASELRPSVA